MAVIESFNNVRVVSNAARRMLGLHAASAMVPQCEHLVAEEPPGPLAQLLHSHFRAAVAA